MADADFKRSYPLRTVCEVTREIYDYANELRQIGVLNKIQFDKLFDLLKEQMRCQKKMDSKLRVYKSKYEKEIYLPNNNYLEDEKRRSEL